MGTGGVSFTADGRMVGVACNGRPELSEGTARKHNSGFGTFTFNGGRLLTKVLANSDTQRLSANQVRDIPLNSGS